LNGNNPLGVLNLFEDGPGGSSQLLRSLVSAGLPSEFDSRALLFSGFASGALFSLPGGDVLAAFGVEWRREQLELNIPSSGVSTSVDAERDSHALAVELLVPGGR
jgi:hypothetical protein